MGLSDLLSAASYALRVEVPLHPFITGHAYSTLLNFVALLEQVRAPWLCVVAMVMCGSFAGVLWGFP